MIRSIEQQMENGRLAIEGALGNAFLLKRLEEYGYGRKKIQEGKALYEKVKLLQNIFRREQADKLEATEQLRAAFNEAHAVYIRHIKLARMAVPHDRELWDILALSGARNRNLNGWLSQAEIFYANVDQVTDAMATFGVMEDELSQAQAMVEAVVDAKAKQNSEISETQQARLQRDQALNELHQWMRKFKQIARIAFEGNAQELQALGITVAS